MTVTLRTLVLLIALATGASWLTAPAVQGAVQGQPIPSPNRAALSFNQSSSFTVVWRVQNVPSTATPSGEVFSPQGRFVQGGIVLGTVNRRLSQNATTLSPATFTFPETVTVPRSVIIQAAKSNTPLIYERSFAAADNLQLVTALPVSLAITGGGGELLLSRIELTFEAPPDARFASVEQDARLRAVARIRFGGSGLLQARWVIADPTSTTGRAVFRTLQIVRRNVAAAGEVEIYSPPLPTRLQGLHELRFEVDDPAIDSPPRLLYQVQLRQEPGLSPEVATISLLSPRPRGLLDDGARISWSAVPGAVAYKVVFLESLADDIVDLEERARYGELAEDPGETRPGETVAGFYLPGDTTETDVPGTSITRLARDRRYYVQVLGWGPDGLVIGRSEPQEVLRR